MRPIRRCAGGVAAAALLALTFAAGAAAETTLEGSDGPIGASAAPAEVSQPSPDTLAPGQGGQAGAVPGDQAQGAEEEAIPPPPSDPLRLWNRAMFAVNDGLYSWVLKPVTQAYRAVFPSVVRTGVQNFFHNLAAPMRFVNNALQGKTREAGAEFGSFMINTTWGLFGFIDWTAKDPDLRVPEEDTGQTFGRWGVGAGPYIVWPVFGPSSLRDSVGMVADWLMDPVWYVKPPLVAFGVGAERRVNYMSFHLGEYEELRAAAIDPYEAIRDAYLQYRAAQVKK